MVLLTNKILGSFESPPQGTNVTSPTFNGNSNNDTNGSIDPQTSGPPLNNPQASYSNALQFSNVAPRSEISLLQGTGKPASFKTGTVPHSVFYALPKEHRNIQFQLLLAIRSSLNRDQGLGLHESESASHIIFEVVLRTASDCNPALTTPIQFEVDGIFHTFPAFAAISSDSGLCKINFTEVPCLGYDVLKENLTSTFSKYGIVRDIVVYEDDMTGTWFRGNGHVYIERPQKSTFAELTHRLHLSENPKHKFLATWAKMGTYCRFCKKLGHRKEACPDRPTENRQCFTCSKKGHIAINCPRAAVIDDTDVTGAKRSRQNIRQQLEIKPSATAPKFKHGPLGSQASIHANPRPTNTTQPPRQTSSVSLGDFLTKDSNVTTVEQTIHIANTEDMTYSSEDALETSNNSDTEEMNISDSDNESFEFPIEFPAISGNMNLMDSEPTDISPSTFNRPITETPTDTQRQTTQSGSHVRRSGRATKGCAPERMNL